MPDHDQLIVLFNRYVSGEAEKREVAELFSLAEKPENEAVFHSLMDGAWEELDALRTRLEKPRAIPLYRRSWLQVAAIFILLAIPAYLFFIPKRVELTYANRYQYNVAPGHPGAKIKLDDGRIIVVDSIEDGLVATQGSLHIYKEKGNIIYKGADGQGGYNEIITDAGRQSTVTLPDGSVAWLNAGSSLRYPLSFTGGQRLVSMTGEVYFKVLHNSRLPFRVQVGSQLIEDIGTEFNVNAYDDESAARTTLVEGAASIMVGGKKVLMTNAGQQAIVTGTNVTLGTAEIDAVTAWKDGFFSFRDAGIETVMRQLSRWYNVRVSYQAKIPTALFEGEIERSLTLAEVLKGLEKSNVHFSIDADRQIVILP